VRGLVTLNLTLRAPYFYPKRWPELVIGCWFFVIGNSQSDLGRNFGKYQMSNPKTQTNAKLQNAKLQTPIHVVFGICSSDICLPAIASLRQTRARRAGCLFAICHLGFVISFMSQYIKHLESREPRAA